MNFSMDYMSIVNGKFALKFTPIQEHLEKLSIEKIGFLPTLKNVYEKFNKHLTITTYNYTKRQVEYLTPETNPDLPCVIALRMSASIPLVFDMFKYNDCLYIDGGVVDLFPVSQAKTEKVLGIFAKETMPSVDPQEHLIQYVFSLLDISFEQQLNNIDLTKYEIIYIDNINVSLSNFHLSKIDILDLFSYGYKKALKHFQQN
jgi:predicted acylesterase/phospholipase RssA